MGETTLRQALDDYRTIYMAYRNFADRTREEYRNDLRDFVKYCERSGIERVGRVGLPIIERYIAQLEAKGFSSMTRKRKAVTIRSFLSFLYQDSYIASNIASKIVLPFTENPTPRILTQVECDQLRRASGSNPRDAAIIEVLLQSGATLSELTRLTLNDVACGGSYEAAGTTNGYVRLIGSRGRKQRLLPLDSGTCARLRKYLATRKHASKMLFLGRSGNALRERGVQKMLRKYLERAGIDYVSIRTLRHTFAANRLAMGIGSKRLQEELGLKDRRSMSGYSALKPRRCDLADK